MKVLVFLFILTCASKARELMRLDEIETYLSKFVLNDVTKDEERTLQDLFKILSLPEFVPALLKNKHEIERPTSYNVNSLVNFLRCRACRSILGAFFVGVRLGLSDERLIKKATHLCVVFKIQTRNVCRGAVELNLPIINYIIRSTPEATPRAFCSLIMQTAHADVCPHSDERFDWTVELPEVPESVAAPQQTNQKQLKVAILTDVHVDPLYEAYGVANTDIDMVYYIGDTIDHGVWATSYDLNKASNRYLIDKMRNSFGEHVLVVPTIGNHEAQPVNQFAPTYVVGEHNTTWLYEALAEKWGPYLTDEARASLLVRGDYSIRPLPGLKVIVINNNVPQRYNWWVVFDPQDAKKNLNWLIQELYESELAGEKVHILAHIPPGAEDLTHTWTREYNRVVNRFSTTIAAEYNGHEHSDQIKLFYSVDGVPINVAWGGGGLTTYSDYNPNYKIVDIDGSLFEPITMQSYSYNMTEANLHPNRRPHWFQLYDLNKSFHLPDLSPASIGNLVNLMSSGGNYLDLYSAYYSKVSDVRWPQCDQECKINNICNIVITVLWDRKKCEEITRLLCATLIL